MKPMSDNREQFDRRRHYHRWSLAAWLSKFGSALRGWWIGSVHHSSFCIHYLATIIVIGLATFFRCDTWEWCMLILCISGVWMAELINSAIESLARAISTDYNPQLRDALDIASGAVLVFSIGSAFIGCLVFLPKLLASLF